MQNTLTPLQVESGQQIHTLAGHTAGVLACAFSPDGRLVLSASEDGTLRQWDVQSGEERAYWHTDAPLTCCAFHPNGRRIVAGDSRGALHWLRLLLDEEPGANAQV